MSSPEKELSLMSLPEDVLLNCIARLSRLYYPTLSRVSKRFRYLLISPELYKTRSLLGRTESCLYVCLDSYPGFYWFTLARRPDQTPSYNKKFNGYTLAKAPIRCSPPSKCWRSNLVSVGSDIYNFVGTINEKNYPSVWILDCRTHMWREGPSLPGKTMPITASAIDEKIYVAGRCKNGQLFKNSVEVFDTRSQTWDPVSIRCSDIKNNFYPKSYGIDQNFHVMTHVVTDESGVFGYKVFAYNSKEGRWNQAKIDVSDFMYSNSYCEIENVLYAFSNGVFIWYDTKVGKWRKLMGLGLLKFPAYVRLSDYGGKLAVVWDTSFPLSKDYAPKKRIWCAVIALEMRNCSDIWGKFEWYDHVLTVPESCDVVKILAATV